MAKKSISTAAVANGAAVQTPASMVKPKTRKIEPAVKPPKDEQQKLSPKNNYTFFRSASAPSRMALLICVFTGMLLATCLLAWYSWFIWLPSLLNWGFSPLSLRCIPAVLGALVLLCLPVYPFALSTQWINDLARTHAAKAAREHQKQREALQAKSKEYEKDMDDADPNKLVALITFSKIELESYYDIGLRHNRRSYVYSITAMWIGFFVILTGLILFTVPLPRVNPELTGDKSLKALSVGSGLVIELISALFLWIYKNSNEQLTYFYNRQIYVHNALFAVRIAETMTNPDEAKGRIIDSILEIQKNTPAAAAKKAKPKPAPVSLSA
ncbi:MAG: hypothetical protein INR69_14060 [Mucilaginibacter polytrichastri]|nr:hypothetical protein [Mucilaginibacter polytrichastri]